MGKPGSWQVVADAVENILPDSHDPFDPKTVANARDLVNTCQLLYGVPEGVGKGYWSTITLWWSGLEIEVFEDRFELYRFQSQKTDIAHFEHEPGTPIPAELLDAVTEALQL